MLRIDIAGGDNSAHERFLIVPVEYGKGFCETDLFRVAAQDPIADGVERAGPEIRDIAGDERADALDHFPGGLVGEGEEKDIAGFLALIEQP